MKCLICVPHQIGKVINYLILFIQLIPSLLPHLFLATYDRKKGIKACNLFLDDFLLLLADFIRTQASGLLWLLKEPRVGTPCLASPIIKPDLSCIFTISFLLVSLFNFLSNIWYNLANRSVCGEPGVQSLIIF